MNYYRILGRISRYLPDWLNHVIWGLCNFWLFRAEVWNFGLFDYSFLLALWRKSLLLQAKFYETTATRPDAKIIARDMRLAAALMKRLEDDDYMELAGLRRTNNPSESKRRRIFKHSEYLAGQDIAYLSKAMKRIQCWWD